MRRHDVGAGARTQLDEPLVGQRAQRVEHNPFVDIEFVGELPGGDVMRPSRSRELMLLVALGALCATSLMASGQSAPRPCRVVCTPTLTLMPAVIRSHLFGGPMVQDLATGATRRLPAST